MDERNAEKIAKRMLAVERAKAGYRPAAHETGGTPAERLAALLERFDALCEMTLIQWEGANKKHLEIYGTTPGGRHAGVQLTRYYWTEDRQPPNLVEPLRDGLDATVTFEGWTVAEESINNVGLEHKELELRRIEDSFELAASLQSTYEPVPAATSSDGHN